jgi:dipeptidyl-peptidase-4
MHALVLLTMLTATAADPFLREYAETRRYNSGRPGSVTVTPDGATALYLRSEAKDPRQMLYALELATGKESVLLTPDAVLNGAAETLTVAEKARLERMRVTARGFVSFQLSDDGAKLLVALSGRLYVVERTTRKVTALKTGEGAALDPQFTPDARAVVYVRNADVQVLDLATNHERAVTTGGTELQPHGLAEFVAQEEMGRFSGLWLAPDSKHLVYQATDHTGVEQFGISDPMHPEREANRFFYPRAGRTNAAVKLFVASLSGGAGVPITWDVATFPYVAQVTWGAQDLTVLVQTREQTREQLLRVDPKTGKTTLLLEETDAAWLNLKPGFPFHLKDGFFWFTERHGADEVELRKPDGTLAGSWVKPGAGFLSLIGFDAPSRALYFSGGPNPTESYLYRVVDGGEPQRVSQPGVAMDSGKLRGGRLIVSRSTSTSMPHQAICDLSGTKLVDLPSVAIEPAQQQHSEIFKLEGEPGSWVSVTRPKDFVKGQKYPVLLEVYGGPHVNVVQHVPQLLSQWFADQGFIVLKVDGRGTPRRGRDWERAIKGDFATLIAGDQLTALAAVGAKLPELDLARVGTTGWSFGGYLSALLALAHPEQIRTAVSGAPVVDWLDYDSHYTERYLGVPGKDGPSKAYEVSSLLSYVKDAKRPLLIMHGTADDNVYFLHTLKLSDALFRAGKPHVVLPLTNFTHMVPEPVVTQRLEERAVQWLLENTK